MYLCTSKASKLSTENIAALDVAVHDVVFVQEDEPQQNLVRILAHNLLVKPSEFQEHVRNAAAAHILLSIRQHTSGYVRLRQDTSGYSNFRSMCDRLPPLTYSCLDCILRCIGLD